MGLLDSLLSGSQGGYGGLLDSLMYQSPLNKPQEVAQSQYDPMGNYTGITPQAAQDPFGPPPQLAQWAQQFAPQTPFSGMTPTAPVQQFAGIPIQPQAAQPAPAAPNDVPSRTIDVGGYQMPQFGSASEPQTPTDVSAASRQSPQQGAQQRPSFLTDQAGPAFGDRLMAGVQNFANAGGPLQALAGGLSGLVSGNRTDAAGIQQQNLKAQYDSLVPMLGPQKAMLAVMNPEAGKILLAQALEKKQYGFQKLDNDTVIRTDPLKGTAEVAYGGERSNTMTGPDGSTLTMPSGADPKTWRNEITKLNADVAAGKKTEVQAKSEKFGNKMENAEKNIRGIEGEGGSMTGRGLDMVPGGNYLQSDKYQKYRQAQDNFITALLRDESGAAIGTAEFKRYEKELFPQPGDGAAIIAQKAEARKTAIDAMKKSAGPGYKSPTSEPVKVRKYNPTTGTIE